MPKFFVTFMASGAVEVEAHNENDAIAEFDNVLGDELLEDLRRFGIDGINSVVAFPAKAE